MTQDYIVSKVLGEARKLPGFPRLRVLDLSCGEGAILAALAEAGCEVLGTHFKEADYIIEQTDKLEHLTIVPEVNLHDPLPFSDGAFDLVLLTEVIEHLESYHTVIREAGRILRDGGHLILTTPNTQRLHSRLQFLLTGHHKLLQRKLGWDLLPQDLYAYHINMVDFPLLHTLLYHSGLRIERLVQTRVLPLHLYAALLYPFQRVMGILDRLLSSPKRQAYAAGARDREKWMTHPVMAFSEQLALVARKEGKDAEGE